MNMSVVSKQTEPTPSKTGRQFAIDKVRALAIVLALFSHGMGGVTGGWDALEAHAGWYYTMRLATRTATPIFLVLFGASTEFAYVRYWRQDSAKARRKVLRRAAQCYLALAVVATAAALGGAGVRQSVKGLFMAASPRGGEIFALYVCLFLLMLVIIPFRIRFGLIPTLLVALAWWPAAAVLQQFAPGDTPAGYAASRLAGIGAVTGPSVLHSVILVSVGMIVGRAILERHEGRWTATRLQLLATTAVAVGVAGVTAVNLGPEALIRGYVDITVFRSHDHPAYFAVGALATVTLIALASLAIKLGVGGPRRVGPFSGASLLSFALGNVAINLFLPILPTPTLAADVVASIGLIAILWLGMRIRQGRQDGRAAK